MGTEASGWAIRVRRSVLAGVLISVVAVGLSAMLIWRDQAQSAERARQDRECLTSIALSLVAVNEAQAVQVYEVSSRTMSSCRPGAGERLAFSSSKEGWVLAIGPSHPQLEGLEERLCRSAVMTVVADGDELGLCWRGRAALAKQQSD